MNCSILCRVAAAALVPFAAAVSAVAHPLPPQALDLTPRGGTIEALAASPTDPLLVLAGLAGNLDTVHRSTDGGRTFSASLEQPQADVKLIGFDAAGRAFARTRSQLWRSDDGGLSWGPAGSLPWGSAGVVRGMAASGAAVDELWATVDIGAFTFYRSFDGGVTWTSRPLPTALPASFTLHPSRPAEAVFLDTQGVTHWTADGGLSWNSAPSPLGSGGFVALTETHVLVANQTNSGVWISDDQGGTWTQSLPVSASTYALLADPSSPGRVFYQEGTGPLRVSIDHGVTWSEFVNIPGLSVSSLAVRLGAPQQLILGTITYGALRANGPGGALRLTEAGLLPLGVFDVALDRANRDHLVAKVQGNSVLTESLDGGASWSIAPLPPVTLVYDAVLDVEGTLHVAGSRGNSAAVYRRGMQGWEELVLPSAGGGYDYAREILVSEENPDLILITAATYNTQQSALFVSQDGGSTWAHSTTGTSGSIFSLGVLEGTASPRIVMQRGVHLQGGDYLEEIRWSDDLGATYSSMSNGLNVVSTFAHSRRTARRVVVGYRDAQPLFLSDTGLSSGSLVGAPVQADDLAVGSVDADLLIRVDRRRAFSSRDAGASWDLLWSPGAPSSGNAPTLHLRADDSEVLIADAPGLVAVSLDGIIGSSVCTPAVANSLERDARLTAHGSTSLARNDVRLHAYRLPHNVFGMFLASQSLAFVANPGGSFGNLCLGGAIGRYVDQISSAGALGEIDRSIDATQLITPMGYVSAAPGDVWAFQLWYRDTSNGVAGSNFTDATSFTWSQ